MRIERIEVLELVAPFADLFGGRDRVPPWLLHPAAHFQASPRLGQYATLVRIHAEGLVGVGEAYGLPEPSVTAALLSELLAPQLIGADALAVGAHRRSLMAVQQGLGHRRGFFVEAVGGLDLALWDLRGKAMGQPVHRLLGGPVRTAVPVYASPVPLRDTPAESAEQACEFVAAGHRGVKLKVGGGVARDLAHAAAVRAAVGDDVELMGDANGAYRVHEAARLAAGLADLGFRWLEEPVAIDDLPALADLRARTTLPIAVGENHFGAEEALAVLQARAADVLTPNVVRVGGISGALRVAAVAEVHGAEVAPHGVGSAVNVAAALQAAATLPVVTGYERNQLPNPLRDDLLTVPFRLVDGELMIPDGPGLGIELDEDTVTRHLRRRTEVTRGRR